MLETSVENQQKLNAREKTANEFKISTNSVAQYFRISRLIAPLKKRLDNGEYKILVADLLSYLSEKNQSVVDEFLSSTEYMIKLKVAKSLRIASEYEVFNLNTVERIFMETDKIKPVNIPDLKLKSEILSKYFTSKQNQQEIEDEILKALEYYRSHLEFKEDDGKSTNDLQNTTN